MTPPRHTSLVLAPSPAAGVWMACLGALLLIASGCGDGREELITLPDQSHAIRALTALEAAGVPGPRGTPKDPRRPEGEWVLTAHASHAPAARRALVDLDLITPRPSGFEALAQTKTLVPSREQLLARWITATAAETQQTLEAVQGVLSARVQLSALPTGTQPDGRPGHAAELAAVVVIRYTRHPDEHRAAFSPGSPTTANGGSHQHTPLDAPIDADAVRAILCRMVSGLEPHRIDIVFSPVLKPSHTPSTQGNGAATLPDGPIKAQALVWAGLGILLLGSLLVFCGVVVRQYLRRRTAAW
ncbi:MAG: hypothetical protein KF864_00555 [Phycisphaeraceae bacterium]|nr:hypothetical protein [Phycisphaeraceae bacterium]